MYSYCYVCSILCILFQCVAMCIVLCVNVYCTTAIGGQLNCSQQIYHNIIFLPQLSSKQMASSMRRIELLSVACLAVPYFPILSKKKVTIFGTNLSNVKCIF